MDTTIFSSPSKNGSPGTFTIKLLDGEKFPGGSICTRTAVNLPKSTKCSN